MVIEMLCPETSVVKITENHKRDPGSRASSWRKIGSVLCRAGSLVLAAAFTVPTSAQPCNPVIDGTYFASQMRTPAASAQTVEIAPIQSLSRDLSIGGTSPATLGAITFSGNGTTCIGILRRGACN